MLAVASFAETWKARKKRAFYRIEYFALAARNRQSGYDYGGRLLHRSAIRYGLLCPSGERHRFDGF